MNKSIKNSDPGKFKAVFDNRIIITMTQVKKKYFVSFEPDDQVKQISQHFDIQNAYNQILCFLMGYVTGHMENRNIDYMELKRIIDSIRKVFKINIVLGIL